MFQVQRCLQLHLNFFVFYQFWIILNSEKLTKYLLKNILYPAWIHFSKILSLHFPIHPSTHLFILLPILYLYLYQAICKDVWNYHMLMLFLSGWVSFLMRIFVLFFYLKWTCIICTKPIQLSFRTLLLKIHHFIK